MSSLLFPMPTLGYVDSREPVEQIGIYESAGRKEFRESWSTAPRTKYRIKVESLRSDVGSRLDFQKLFTFYARHRGPLDSFLFSDPEDQTVTDHGFAVGDGVITAFQLQRTLQGDILDAAGFQYKAQSKPYSNLIANSSFETDSNADGLADNWNVYNNSIATEPTVARIIPGLNGGKAQRVSWGINNSSQKGLNAGTNPSGVQGGWLPGQWYTITFFARAFGSVVGTTMQPSLNWNNFPSTALSVSNPALSNNWQRYVFQVIWNVGTTPEANGNIFLSIAAGAAVFGDLDIDLVQVTVGQFTASDLQPVETPAAAAATRNPSYWPALGDGFEPIFDLSAAPTIYQDGDWGKGSGPGKRTLYPFTRTNVLFLSEQIDNAGWTKTNATVTANTTVAPDGTTTAETISEGTALGTHGVVSSGHPGETPGQLWCWSIFLKANSLPNIFLSEPGPFINGVKFNLSTGAIDGQAGTQANGVITDPRWLGWYRVWFVVRAIGTTGTNLFVNGCLDATYSSAAYTGTSRTFFAWGAMCERVSNLLGPTPYIATPSSAAVTVTDYTMSSLGVVTPAAVLPAGAFLSADLNYYRRCRFEDQSLSAQRIVQSMWGTGLGLISVRP